MRSGWTHAAAPRLSTRQPRPTPHAAAHMRALRRDLYGTCGHLTRDCDPRRSAVSDLAQIIIGRRTGEAIEYFRTPQRETAVSTAAPATGNGCPASASSNSAL